MRENPFATIYTIIAEANSPNIAEVATNTPDSPVLVKMNKTDSNSSLKTVITANKNKPLLLKAIAFSSGLVSKVLFFLSKTTLYSTSPDKTIPNIPSNNSDEDSPKTETCEKIIDPIMVAIMAPKAPPL